MSRVIKIALVQQSYVVARCCVDMVQKKDSETLCYVAHDKLESWHLDLSQKMKEKTKKCIKEASQNAQLVLLQELHTTQYFCQSENVKYFGFADEFESNVKFFSQIAKDCGVVLVTSLFEKRAVGLYHNTAVVFEKNGEIAGKYRKMHIPDDPQFYEKFYFAPGDLGFKPIATSVGNLGILVCWDQWFPEAARLMCLAGADILIYPTAIGWFDSDLSDEKQRQLDAWLTIQRSHAIANGVPLASINRVGFEPKEILMTKYSKVIESDGKDTATDSTFSNYLSDSHSLIPPTGLKPTPSPQEVLQDTPLEGIRFFGNSFVCDPQGEILARASSDKEEILYASINFERTKEVRDIWPFFRDRRVDFYKKLTKMYIDK